VDDRVLGDKAFERLEPCARKRASTVLRGEGRSNAPFLPGGLRKIRREVKTVFRSKIRPLIIPQYEHGRLAGMFASLWGNQEFKKPTIDFAAFVQGVTFHDWHYGVIDNLAIGAAPEDDWLEIVEQGVDYQFSKPIADIVAKLHLKRLLSGRDSTLTSALMDRIENRIAARLKETNLQREQFEWADKITAGCDQMAFDFSFEKPVQGSFSVFKEEGASKETKITYEIHPKGEISIAPWPFSVTEYHGIIIGYQAQDYPGTLAPEAIPFRCHIG